MLENILICPKTQNRISIDTANNIAKVEQSDLSYPIKDDIIDFLPDTSDRISKAYDSIASSYDDYMNLASLKWKLFTLFAWGFLDDKGFAQKVLSFIPDDFNGVLLDVPVGTGTHTVEKYQELNKARIVVIDYSLGMLQRAKKLYSENGIYNVTFIRGDVGNIPVQPASIDFCLSMNGFHAFPDKDQALHEIVRVLKHDAIFSGCFYVKGKRLLTDLGVKHIFSKKGFFTAPFYNEQEWLSKLGEYFTAHYTANRKSSFYFMITKNIEN
jgi:ubiquinone/menaquinone biosynthesis C-methylase UbiE